MIYFNSTFGEQVIGATELIIATFATLLVPIAFYVFRTIGVFMLAKKAKIKVAFLAFFPGLWIYPFAMLIKEIKFFKSTIGKWAIVFTILTTASILLSFAYEFLIAFPLVGNLLEGRNIYIAIDEGGAKNLIGKGFVQYQAISGIFINMQTTAVNGAFVYPYQFVFIEKWLNLITIFSDVLSLCVTIIEFVLFFNVFKKYWPQHFVLATIFSIFGAFPIFVFIIRNKQPLNYFDYLRTRYQNYGPYSPYGYGPRGPQGNPNNPNNPYTQNGYGNTYANAQNNPFQDFEPKKNNPEEPFADFNSNDKKDDN